METALRIVGIITPVLLISAIGYVYGRLRKPDMSWINQLSIDLFFPLLIFSSMASKESRSIRRLARRSSPPDAPRAPEPMPRCPWSTR